MLRELLKPTKLKEKQPLLELIKLRSLSIRKNKGMVNFTLSLRPARPQVPRRVAARHDASRRWSRCCRGWRSLALPDNTLSNSPTPHITDACRSNDSTGITRPFFASVRNAQSLRSPESAAGSHRRRTAGRNRQVARMMSSSGSGSALHCAGSTPAN